MTIPFSATETARLCREGLISPVEAVVKAFERIASAEEHIDAFLHLDRNGALRRARRLEKEGPPPEGRGLLFGVPVAVKDNICVHGMPNTCASRILEGFKPLFSATAIERMLGEGAIVVGKTNMDEFGMGSSTEHSAFKLTRNPWCRELSPGGSSGGSAAAVGARAVPLALGSDTGGSIRQPAALCGAVGFKPTYGSVSRYGLVAFASSLDQIGPLSLDVSDAALLFRAIAGHDPRDSTSIRSEAPDVLPGLEDGIAGLRVGMPAGITRGMNGAIETRVRETVRSSYAVLESLGADLVDIELPLAEYAVAAYYLVATSEASSNLARFDGVRYGPRADGGDLAGDYAATRGRGFGREVKRRIILGTHALSSGYYDDYYLKALKVRRLIMEGFDRAFELVDLIAAPTSPVAGLALGERIDDPLSMYLCDTLTVPASLAGIPAVSVPCGLTGIDSAEASLLQVASHLPAASLLPVASHLPAASHLPVGVQFMGPAQSDGLVLRAARAFESKRGGEPILSPLARTMESL